MASKFIILITWVGLGCGSNASQSLSNKPIETIIGCSNFIVYLVSDDTKSYYQIYLDAEKYKLKINNIFDLSNGEIIIHYRQFASEILHTLCTDIRPNEPIYKISEKKALSGTVRVSLSDKSLNMYNKGESYELNIELINIKFDETSPLFSLQVDKVNVGWQPG